MHTRFHTRLMLIGLCLMLSAKAADASADESLLVIVHPSVKADALSGDSLSAIFTLTKRTWSDGRTIIPYNHDPGTKPRVLFDRVVLDFTEQQSARFWIDFRIRGGGSPPRRVPSSALMVRVVARLPGAIGYVPYGTPVDGTRVVARITNGRVLPGGER